MSVASATAHGGYRWRVWDNSSGQLGRDTGVEIKSPDPELVAGLSLSNGTIVSATLTGGAHTCALLSDLSLQCWGSNDRSQLGTTLPEGATQTFTPTPVETLF